MRHIILAAILCIIGLVGNVFALPVTDGLVIHLDAGSITGFADGANIDTWSDISGNGNDATQPTAGNQPIYVAGSPNFNGNSVVRFDGADDWMALPSTSITVGSFTVFAVAKFNYTENNQYIMDGQDGSGNDRIRFEWDNTQAEPFFEYRAGSSGWQNITAPADTGLHVFAMTSTIEGFLDGASLGTTANTSNENPTAFNIGSYNRGEKDFFDGELAEFVVYNRVLSSDEIIQVSNFLAIKTTQYVVRNTAYKPSPANEEIDIQRDTILSWKPGEFAATHNVYLGTNFDDVNNANASSPLLIGPANDVNNFDPGRLEFDQTYFWRVDEVNGVPDYTTFKGDIWSFTVESYSIAIPEEDITATASSQSGNQGPENTISIAGLDANDLHSTNTANMWITADGDPGPTWIQYEFDKAYQLLEMPVWNYNGNSILTLFGIKDVVVEYSLDGTNWEQITDVTQFTKATGAEDYAYNTVVDFNNSAAKYVKINANSSWGGDMLDSTQLGLSEVRFIAIPVAARKPNPDDGDTDITVNTTLSWKAGRNAAEHKVFFGTDKQSVIDGTALVTTTGQTSYDPLSLNLGSIYYWRIDEVNNAEANPVWEGAVWSFSTQEYLVVEDFESYNEIPEGEEGSNLVYLTWIDGYDDLSVNGSTMGYTSGSSLETDITHEDSKQSVPLMYNNTTASYSEATVRMSDLAIGGNWAAVSPEFLSIWFYGDTDNPATDQMYADIDGAKKVYEGDLTQEEWQEWIIDLASLSINLSNVGTLTIGFEKTGATGGTGMIFLDDIQLYKPQEE